MTTTEIVLPQLSVNDEKIALVRWLKQDGARVTAGEPVCAVETSKAASDVLAETDGYLRVLLVAGQQYPVGSVAAVLTPTADEPVVAAQRLASPSLDPPVRGGGERRVTKKAEMVARSLNVDLASIPGTGTVTEEMVRAAARGRRGTSADNQPVAPASMVARGERVLVVGGGRGASQVLDIIAQRTGRDAVGILDDDPDLRGTLVMGVPVLGSIDGGRGLIGRDGYDSVVITFGGGTQARAALFETLSGQGVRFANLVHPQTVVHPTAQLGAGNVVAAMVRIGPQVSIGNNNFFSAFCNIEHHCRIGSHCTFGPAVFLSGSVEIADRVLFGTGIHIEPWITIGCNCIIASGVTLTQHVPDGHSARTTTLPIIGAVGPGFAEADKDRE